MLLMLRRRSAVGIRVDRLMLLLLSVICWLVILGLADRRPWSVLVRVRVWRRLVLVCRRRRRLGGVVALLLGVHLVRMGLVRVRMGLLGLNEMMVVVRVDRDGCWLHHPLRRRLLVRSDWLLANR